MTPRLTDLIEVPPGSLPGPAGRRTVLRGNAPRPGSLPPAVRLVLVLLGLAAVTFGAGCGGVPVHQQRLVAKPNMQFSTSAVFAYQSPVLAQIETGAALSGGAQAAGCTSCR
jgi:hypothetical protein